MGFLFLFYFKARNLENVLEKVIYAAYISKRRIYFFCAILLNS